MTQSNNCLLFAACVGVAVAVLTTGPVHGQIEGPYFTADAGVNLAQDQDVEAVGIKGTQEMEPGFRIGLGGAWYDFNSHVGVGLETGFLYNGVKGADVWVGHVPLLVTPMLFYEPPQSKWVCYIGGGVGGALSILSVDEAGLSDTSTDFGLAWQGMAGVRYKLGERMSIGLGYKYFGTQTADFELRNVPVAVSKIHNHAVSVVFGFKF